MPYRKSYGRKSYGRRKSGRRRRASGGRGTKRIVIEVRHTGAPQIGPGGVSPTLGKKGPEQLRPRF